MPDIIAFHGRNTPQKVSIRDIEKRETLTYGALDRKVGAIAALLQDRLGANSGARVAMLSRNSALMLVMHLACARAGAIFVPLNWRLAPPEIAALIADAAPKAIVWQAEFDAHAESALTTIVKDCQFRLEKGSCAISRAAEGFTPLDGVAARDENAPIALLYTSGTSGRSKGVILTEKTLLYSALNYGLSAGMSGESVFLCDMPLFHVAGLLAASRTTLFYGGTVVVSQRFDPVGTYENLTDPDLGISHYFCVTQMAAQMRAAHPEGAMKKLSHLKVLQTGGAPNPPASVSAWANDGVRMSDGFGMTEIGSAFNMPAHDLDTIRRKAGSIGFPSMFLEAKIMTPDGDEAKTGEIGELWVKGPNVTPGYWNKPVETAAAFHDGWLKTGDSARQDDEGFYYIVDRTKDMYISGGENVYPVEVEAALAEMAAILDCAVIGVPDERWGETGVAYVLLKPEAPALTDKDVIAHIRSRLAAFKAPKHVAFVKELPRTPSGKVQKHVLKAKWLAENSGT
ncbi:MAG: AMP-binding protein [Parvularculaceae bacterium]